MATYTKEFLSGSTNGRGIKVVATASPGTTIHTSDATAKDEIWIFAYNSDSVARLLTVQLGGTTSPDDDVKISVPSQQGLLLIIPGQPLSGAVVVKAYGAVANVLTIVGFVNRIA